MVADDLTEVAKCCASYADRSQSEVNDLMVLATRFVRGASAHCCVGEYAAETPMCLNALRLLIQGLKAFSLDELGSQQF